MDRIVSGVLRGGVLLSASVTLAGGIWYAIHGGNAAPDYRIFHGEKANLRSLAGTLQGIAEGHPESLIQLGLMLLIATPVARVAVSLVSFSIERDWLYVGITAVVLLVLLVSLTGVL